MSIIILGHGLLGKQIADTTDWDFVSRSKNNISAENFKTWSETLLGYEIIINCIANTDTYSDDRNKHWDVNYKFVNDLVDFCNENNKKLVHISTDYIYENSKENASENDIPVHGKTWYAYTKLLADGLIQLRSNHYLLIRCGHKPNPFPYEVAWDDQFGNFDYVDVIASKIIALIKNGVDGVFNVGTETKTIFDLAKKTKENITPAKKPSRVPDNTSMDLTKMKSLD
jgi:dTDP-4-dehydrorhamnose reductase